jgi:hypothetical protein
MMGMALGGTKYHRKRQGQGIKVPNNDANTGRKSCLCKQ